MPSTFIELHILQNFAPSCLNRDDTNAPKDCVFGGVRRARISSQCLKRSVRRHATFQERLHDALGTRTKALVKLLGDRLASAWGADAPEDVRGPLELLVEELGLGLKEGKTEYLLFLGEDTVRELVSAAREHWDVLAAAASQAAAEAPAPTEAAQAKKKAKKKAKKSADGVLPADVRDRLRAVFRGGTRAVDVALFGRMVADIPEMHVDGACQVAHAISTNAVEMEMDFFTAVDDLQPKEETGAGMMGMVEFNSACFYRYSLVDWGKLVENLGRDEELARKAVRAYVEASVRAVPSGKQNSTAAYSPPALVYASVRTGGMPRSLSDAFVRPVRQDRERDLVQGSVAALAGHRDQLNAVYGDDGARDVVMTVDPEAELAGLAEVRVPGLQQLLDAVEEELAGAGAVRS